MQSQLQSQIGGTMIRWTYSGVKDGCAEAALRCAASSGSACAPRQPSCHDMMLPTMFFARVFSTNRSTALATPLAYVQFGSGEAGELREANVQPSLRTVTYSFLHRIPSQVYRACRVLVQRRAGRAGLEAASTRLRLFARHGAVPPVTDYRAKRRRPRAAGAGEGRCAGVALQC